MPAFKLHGFGIVQTGDGHHTDRVRRFLGLPAIDRTPMREPQPQPQPQPQPVESRRSSLPARRHRGLLPPAPYGQASLLGLPGEVRNLVYAAVEDPVDLLRLMQTAHRPHVEGAPFLAARRAFKHVIDEVDAPAPHGAHLIDPRWSLRLAVPWFDIDVLTRFTTALFASGGRGPQGTAYGLALGAMASALGRNRSAEGRETCRRFVAHAAGCIADMPSGPMPDGTPSFPTERRAAVLAGMVSECHDLDHGLEPLEALIRSPAVDAHALARSIKPVSRTQDAGTPAPTGPRHARVDFSNHWRARTSIGATRMVFDNLSKRNLHADPRTAHTVAEAAFDAVVDFRADHHPGPAAAALRRSLLDHAAHAAAALPEASQRPFARSLDFRVVAEWPSTREQMAFSLTADERALFETRFP